MTWERVGWQAEFPQEELAQPLDPGNFYRTADGQRAYSVVMSSVSAVCLPDDWPRDAQGQKLMQYWVRWERR